MRYVVTLRKRGGPVVHYLSKRGCVGYAGPNMAVFQTLQAARDERDYFAVALSAYEVGIERLPARVEASKAVLSAVVVE